MQSHLVKIFLPYVLIQAFSFQFAKDSLSYASPYVFMAARYLIASSILLLISRKIVLDKFIVLISFFYSASSLFWILGLEYVSPGDSAILSYTIPFFAIPMAFFTIGERATRWEVFGAFVGFCGIAAYSIPLDHGSQLIGVLFTLMDAAFWAAMTVLYRKTRNKDPVSLVGTQYLFGSFPFILGSFLYPQVDITQDFVFDLLYLSILGGAVSLFLWNGFIRKERVSKASVMTLAVPASTVGIQSIETLSIPNPVSILGAAIMFLGIYLSTRRTMLPEEEMIRSS